MVLGGFRSFHVLVTTYESVQDPPKWNEPHKWLKKNLKNLRLYWESNLKH